MQISRREFMRRFGASAAGGALAINALTKAGVANAASDSAKYYGGNDLSTWSMGLGDAQWAANGQAWPYIADLDTQHHGTESELFANVQQRGIMTHNITGIGWQDVEAFDYVHVLSYEFRIPVVPSTWQTPNYNAQTVEGGFFIWDGPNTRKDYGIAFQWILNPWVGDFGAMRMWDGDAGWRTVSYLQPDTNWHKIDFVFDHRHNSASLIIDGVSKLARLSQTSKPSYWGTDTTARFQAEVISIWPGQVQTAPQHRAYFRNWSSAWLPYFDNVSVS
ncbi:MAG: hypothetical protein AAF902_12325 [Chloroflexota bacterium]